MDVCDSAAVHRPVDRAGFGRCIGLAIHIRIALHVLASRGSVRVRGSVGAPIGRMRLARAIRLARSIGWMRLAGRISLPRAVSR